MGIVHNMTNATKNNQTTWVSPREASDVLLDEYGIKRTHMAIRRWAAKGYIRCIDLDGKHLIDLDSIRAYIDGLIAEADNRVRAS